MKLEPVYLVAPRPKPPSMPTRRAFLFMGVAFAGGSIVGAACGYSIGSASGSDELPLTGDPDLDEWRRLAVKAPLKELVRLRHEFMVALDRDYPEDAVLWQGLNRLAAAVATDAAFPDRRRAALFVLRLAEARDPEGKRVAEQRKAELRVLAR